MRGERTFKTEETAQRLKKNTLYALVIYVLYLTVKKKIFFVKLQGKATTKIRN